MNCDFYNNGDAGHSAGDGNKDQMNCLFLNNNFIDNATYGLRSQTQPTPGFFLGNSAPAGTAANGTALLEYDKWFTATSTVNYPGNSTPYNNPATMDFRITLDQAEGAGYGFFTQEHPSYSDTIAYPSIGAAQQ